MRAAGRCAREAWPRAAAWPGRACARAPRPHSRPQPSPRQYWPAECLYPPSVRPARHIRQAGAQPAFAAGAALAGRGLAGVWDAGSAALWHPATVARAAAPGSAERLPGPGLACTAFSLHGAAPLRRCDAAGAAGPVGAGGGPAGGAPGVALPLSDWPLALAALPGGGPGQLVAGTLGGRLALLAA
jgi:hypothetical protein